MSETPPALAPEALAALADKLDRFLRGEHPMFTRADSEELRKATAFVGAFQGDPATLLRVQQAFQAVEGTIRVGKVAGYVLAFVVVTWTQWDRLLDLLTGRPAP